MATQRENYPEVFISKTITVYPKLPVQHHRVLNLSNLDRQCPMPMYLVYFYKPSQAYKNLTLHSVFIDLKSGLEETLSMWYPAAGRLISDDQYGGKLNLWCNNDGAILVEAHTQVKISELGNLSQYNGFFEKLVYKPVFKANFSNMPLVVAQVTKFGCGGYSIGVGTSHSLFDGPAAYNFMCAWASNTPILKTKAVNPPKPVHERAAPLLTANVQLQAANETAKLPSKAAAISHLYQLIMQATREPNFRSPQIGRSDQTDFVLKTYHLSAASIHDLKRKHFGESRDLDSYSSFELLAAHLWKARTKAFGLRGEKMVCLQFAVDARNKVVPPIPSGFSGNAYVLASVMMAAKELEEASYEAMVEKIREAKHKVNNDYVKAYIEALEAPQASSLPPLKELTVLSDWTRMPFHKVKFFHEEAAYASPLASPMPQVAYLMQSPINSKGVDIRIGLDAQTINAFSYNFLNQGQ